MKISFWGSLLATVIAVGSVPAQAEDIDLFVQPVGTENVPNVLFLIDNTANWSRSVDGQAIQINEKLALQSVFNNLKVNGAAATVRVGVMLFTETGGGNNAVDGGYIRAAIRDMTPANKVTYAALIASLDQNGDKSNGGKAGKTMAEAYYYFNGLSPVSGNSKVKTDYTGNTSGTAASQAIYALTTVANGGVNAIGIVGQKAKANMAAVPYHSPLPAGACNNYIIFISNGAAQDNAADNTAATNMLATAAANEGIAGATSPIALTPSGSATNVADEWARFMEKTARKVVTYTIDVDPILTGQGPGWSRLLKSMASDDASRYVVSTSGGGGTDLAAKINDILSKIQAVNSVFASVSLPVSVNTEGTYLNQVYIGMFRPDRSGLPRWAGNLKQYKLARFGDNLLTVDAFEWPGTISSGTGFIDRCARSFWTPTALNTDWAFYYVDTAFLDANKISVCESIPAYTRPDGTAEAAVTYNQLASAQSDVPDGNFVEKGAQAYVRRGSTTRTVRTCSGDCSSGLVTFDNANVSTADLGAADATERDALINWEKGLDVLDENGNTTTNEMRPSTHGDVVHSRPVAINYAASDADPVQVVVYYGGNDGVLRGINGNRSTAVNAVPAGQEFWSFIAPEFHAKIKPLKDNNVEVAYKDTVASPTQPKPYGMDGPISSYRSGANIWIFAGMRRGGRALYAFDVSGLTSGTAPTLKWKKGCGVSGCSGGMDDIGQTWSAAKVIKAAGYGTPAKPMLIFGGGYDTCQDADPATCVAAATGDHIYILDADDGSKLKEFDVDSQIVGDVVISPDPVTGFAKWGYAADMKGNVYRISGAGPNTPIGATDPGSWTITKIAALGCATTAACATPRKFMFAPGVVNESGTYFLLIGSGDREKPLRAWPSAYATSNYFFMIKDSPLDDHWYDAEVARCGSGITCLDSLQPILSSSDPTSADLADKKGWYLGFNSHEQVVTTALTVFGTTTFSTHTPVPAGATSCGVSSLGTARVYNVSYKNAATQNGTNNRSEVIAGGGLPPSPVGGMVRLDTGELVPFLIGGEPDSPLQGFLPHGPNVGSQPKAITYWYIQK